jgi:DNA-binding protein H-NS
MILRAWADDRKCLETLELENLGLLDAAVKSAERIEALEKTLELERQVSNKRGRIAIERGNRIGPLERKAAAYKEAYLSERAYHANNTGENAARRKRAVAALREADDG